MLSLSQRFELLERDLAANPPAFVVNADLPFALFRYDPFEPDEREWVIRREIKNLATRIQNNTGRTVHLFSMAALFWNSIQESEGVAALIEMEKERGFEEARVQAAAYLTDEDFCPLTRLVLGQVQHLDAELDLVFWTQGTAFSPAMYRLHVLPEQLMGKTDVPAVFFYPGAWHGSLSYMGLKGSESQAPSYRVRIYGDGR